MHAGSYKEVGELEKYFAFIEKSSHKLAGEIFRAMLKYQKRLESKQMLLGRLMEIGTDLFAMAATCSYALSLKDGNGQAPIELADYFCRMAKRRIQRAVFKALASNDDRQANAVAKQTIDKKYRWLEKDVVWMGPDE